MDAKSNSAAAELLSKWFDAFGCPYSNAFIDGCNNAIKALKHFAFGFRNFYNFRTRILQAVSPSRPNF